MIDPADVKELLRIIRKVDGLSGANVINSRDGIVIGQPSNSPPRGRRSVPDLFPVKIVQVGGADGTSSTPATWTYDIYALTGTATDDADAGELLAESQDIAPSRPNGKRNAGDLYGLAFYDGDTLILWDAGEYENTGEGCAP
jgi:hypothetical protein